jgi:hypothetical protein
VRELRRRRRIKVLRAEKEVFAPVAEEYHSACRKTRLRKSAERQAVVMTPFVDLQDHKFYDNPSQSLIE